MHKKDLECVLISKILKNLLEKDYMILSNDF